MRYTMFGNTGMEVSRLCLGAMTFGFNFDEAETARVIDEALDKGVNFIDTAESYGYGRSEELLGEILEGEKRERVYLATKVFRQTCRDRHVGRNSRVNILRSLEESLRRMRTDYVDLFMLHHPDVRTPVEETLETLDRVVRQGKARYVGVSNHYAWQMAWMLGECKARNWEPLASLQANYNVLDRQIESETVPFCRKFNVPIMCYSPLCNGILSGKYRGLEPDAFPKESRGTHWTLMKPYFEDPVCQDAVERLAAMADEQDLGMNQIAILWLLAKPHATTVIVGGSKPEHFSQVYEVADRELPQEVVEAIDAFSAPRIRSPYMSQPNQEGFVVSATR